MLWEISARVPEEYHAAGLRNWTSSPLLRREGKVASGVRPEDPRLAGTREHASIRALSGRRRMDSLVKRDLRCSLLAVDDRIPQPVVS